MEPASTIRRIGFKRWYERQLIESHAWLTTCFLCALAIAASLEAVSFKESSGGALLATFAFVFVAGLVCWHGLQRYRAIMDTAERLGDQSICAACRVYARFEVIAEEPRLRVRCRRCAHEWAMD